MELKDTVDMMWSDDFKERMCAEYYQLKIRYDKLHKMVILFEAGKLEFEPKCPLELLKKQEKAMRDYMDILEVRAAIEGVDL